MSQIIAVGFSSRMQKEDIELVYQQYLSPIKDIVDRDLGIITSHKTLEEALRELSKEKTMLLIFTLSGGSRGFIIKALKEIDVAIIISYPKQNALASSLHALYIIGKREKKKILHVIGSPSEINYDYLRKVITGWKKLVEMRNNQIILLGVDSRYLDEEQYDIDNLKKNFGLTVQTVTLKKFIESMETAQPDKEALSFIENTRKEFEDNDASIKLAKMFSAVKDYLKDKLAGGIRCFPIILETKITPCISVSLTLARNKILACEADLASLVTMLLAKAVSEKSPFIGNPEQIKDNIIVLAHCTAALDLIENVIFRSHFESGYPYAVQGEFKEEYVTLLKVSPSFDKIFAVEGRIILGKNFSDEFCRNQMIVKLDEPLPKEFLNGDYGHHIVVIYGKNKDIILSLSKLIGLGV